MSSEQLEAERKAFAEMMANEFGIVDVEDMMRNGSARDQMRVMIAKKAWQAARSQPAAPRVVSDLQLDFSVNFMDGWLQDERDEVLRNWENVKRAALQAIAPAHPAFQARVSAWMEQCFVPSLYSNMTERGDRLLEEVLELLQSNGYDQARVDTLVRYVFGRPAGVPSQEVGGVMVTLAGYCWIAGLDMHVDGETELSRITQPEVMAKIRAKQEKKNALHFDTPLPGGAQPAQPSVPVSKVTMPVRLPPLAVSEIKDMLAREYGLFDFKARPLWAQMVKILAGISIEEQEKLIAAHDGKGE